MDKLIQALVSLAKGSPRASGAIMIGLPVAWLIWRPTSLFGKILATVWVMAFAVLATYPIEWAWKQMARYWRSRCWLSELPDLSDMEKRHVQGMVQSGRPYWIWRRHWNYLLHHPELIETPMKPRDKPTDSWML